MQHFLSRHLKLRALSWKKRAQSALRPESTNFGSDLQSSKQFIWQKYSTPRFVGPLNIFHSEGVLPEEEAQTIPVIGQRMASPLVWTSARYRLSGEWRYPNDFHQSRTIEVAKGHIINVQFKRFNLADSNDFVQITDGDGTFLGHFGPKHWSDQSWNVSSFTETVHVLFHTDQSGTEDGWELEWSE